MELINKPEQTGIVRLEDLPEREIFISFKKNNLIKNIGLHKTSRFPSPAKFGVIKWQ